MAEGLDKNSWFWIDSQDEFEQLVQQWSASDEIALDTEFHREKTYYPRLALLQVGWAGKVALIDPIKIDLAPLKQLFACPVLVILHAGIQDLEILSRVVGAVPAKIFDTQLAAGFIGYSNPSLALLSERILAVALPKGDRLTDWTKRPLSQSQLRYAASDVSNLIELKHVIEQDLIRMNRLDWALDESRILLERDRSQVPLERAPI
ncbi:MAG: ribonuclease D, partial [Actinobacteria bacterium]|nr:ribonuclease D [Actinomycetota bacterium]